MKVELTSLRKYEIYEVVNGNSSLYNLLMNDLLFNENEASETIYALRDIIDEIMDIPLNCTMSFKPNRDIKNLSNFALITRIR